MRYASLLLFVISIICYSADIIVGNPESSGCAPIGIG